MAEKPRVLAFDTVEIEDGDWDGPHPHGEFLTYRAKSNTASIKVTKNGRVVVDGDYREVGKTIPIDDDVIHLPEGLGPEI